MMNNIWFDVSLVRSWGGHLGGVMRCEAQIAAELLQAHADKVIFCYWDDHNQLVQLSADGVRRQLECMAVLVPPKAQQPSATATEQLQARIIELAQKLRQRLIRVMMFWVGQGVIQKLRDWSNWLTQLALQSQPVAEPLLAIGAKDVYVSVGAGWVIDRFNYLYHLKRAVGFKTVLLCHDLIPVRFPDLSLEWIVRIFPYYLTNMAWCADVILCNSKTTENDLRDFLKYSGAPEPQLQVVHYGSQIQEKFSEPITKRVSQILRKKFILYVSTIELRKNHEILCQAYLDLVSQGHRDLPLLVFVGSWGWGVQGLQSSIQTHPELSQWIVCLEGLQDAELAALYRSCLFTVYPSYYEGWGLPVAESLAFGKYCLASQAPSLQEVGGDFIEYLDTRDARLWAQKILWYFDHPEQLKQKEHKIQQQFIALPWSQTGDEIVQICQAQLK